MDETEDIFKEKDIEERPRFIISEEEASNAALKIMDGLSEEIREQIATKFYEKMQDYLYEHHANYQDKLFNEVFGLLCGDKWNRYRKTYDAQKLRARIYEENKKDINKLLIEQVVEENISQYFGLFLCDEGVTGWKYTKFEEAVVKWIYENYNGKSSKLKKLMPKKLIEENKRLKNKISALKNDLDEIRGITGGD